MKSKLPTSFRITLFFVLTVLCLIGLFFVFEASTVESFAAYGHQYHFLIRQAVWLGVGLAAFGLCQIIPIKLWEKLSAVFFVIGLLALLAVFIPGLGLEINGARRWISYGAFQLQPVEFFKLCLVLFFSRWLAGHQRILPFLFLTGIPALVLLAQPDLGSLLVLLLIASAMFFTAGGNVKKMLPFVGVGILGLILVVVVSPYRLKRVQTFLNPQSDPLGASFQVRQITLALGSGGWFGRGLGNSQQKYAFIPEVSSDSIFAVVAEEIGWVGCLVILSLFLLYFYLIYKIITYFEPGSFAQLFGIGVLVWIAGQAAVNLAAIAVLIPLTGLPLPFFSYGGSSLISILIANGILFKLARSRS